MGKSLKHTVVLGYLLLFYILMLYKWKSGLWLFQLQPLFFRTRPDLFTWVFMQTRLHLWLLDHPARWILADTLFYTAPLFYYITYRWAPRYSWGAALYLLAVHWCYIQCYTLYPFGLSIEGFVGWLLFPIVFLPTRDKTFVFLWEGLRYFFLFFFASAGIWKLMQGGIFNGMQMSAILLDQHKDLLYNSPGAPQACFFRGLIGHPALSYALYAGATLMELSFITGFFTRRYDRVLAGIFAVFVLADVLLMRIDYTETLPLILTLLLSTKKPGQTAGPFFGTSNSTKGDCAPLST
ncbi:hypothetical protein [Dinghuibacter silviterrae]|uniref:Uncharacterized protein n=1 Tax=Dinghuibacter silviterrae TaxID=1539049 RepID=A0A4R8DEK7_9BACT|nr:hypothetical protein [Dinghuibacter silviterrae]TDW95971.1 hypothetical protein EDB95_3792 [Dinghuibacter silviterrae]